MQDPERISSAWRQFKIDGDRLAREALIEYYQSLVGAVVGRLRLHPPTGVELADLYQAGMVGLISSIDGYDPSQSNRFESYAGTVIRGSVQEFLRQWDPLKRTMRTKLRAYQQAVRDLTHDLGRSPSADEIATRLKVTVTEVGNLESLANSATSLSLDEQSRDSDGLQPIDLLADHAADPEQALLAEETRENLARALAALPEREQLVVNLYYVESLTFKEIGKVLDRSEARAHQIFRDAMERLRRHLIRLNWQS